jgi:hypothetical protein
MRVGVSHPPKFTVAVFVLFVSLALPAAGQVPEFYKPKEEKLPLAVAPQPLPFSHKQHAEARITCLDCHSGAAKKERAGLPQTDQCMLCHSTIAVASPAVRRLAKLHEQGEKIDWVRVYQVPDFVFFSHASHWKAGVDCATCHGPVAQRDVLAQEVSTGMVRCMNCHADREASNECVLCHQLGH